MKIVFEFGIDALTRTVEIGHHHPDGRNDGCEAKHVADKDPDASATRFHASARKTSVSVNLKTEQIINIKNPKASQFRYSHLCLGDGVHHKQAERAQDAQDHVDGVHRMRIHWHCVDQEPPAGEELNKQIGI